MKRATRKPTQATVLRPARARPRRIVARILVVDDEDRILAAMKEYLESSMPGTQVLTAESGAEALDILKRGDVDLVFADYRMPVMDGLQFLRSAREVSPSTARVMITAYPDLQVAMDGLNQAGIARFLVKPLTPKHIMQVALEILEGRKGKLA